MGGSNMETKQLRIGKLNQDFFTNLPEEIIKDILSRLPIPTIVCCKCVCKLWLCLIESREFIKAHFSKSVPCLALFQGKKGSKRYKILEFVDTPNYCRQLFSFSFPRAELHVHSSANGLLLLLNQGMNHNTYICNPITREYIKLPPIWSTFSEYERFGLGVSKLTGQYKVVRWFEDYAVNSSTKAYAPWKCGVYTLGTGLWRTIVAVSAHAYWLCGKVSVFLNGNLHLLVSKEKLGVPREIACFDLETESFSTFFVPDHPTDRRRTLCALGDCLCLCDTSRGCVDIWLMSKYGDDKSWTKEFAIRTKLAHGKDLVPIKIFSEQGSRRLHCYSSKCKTTTIRHIDLTGSFDMSRMEPAVYAPSFLPLKNFATENVRSF